MKKDFIRLKINDLSANSIVLFTAKIMKDGFLFDYYNTKNTGKERLAFFYNYYGRDIKNVRALEYHLTSSDGVYQKKFHLEHDPTLHDYVYADSSGLRCMDCTMENGIQLAEEAFCSEEIKSVMSKVSSYLNHPVQISKREELQAFNPELTTFLCDPYPETDAEFE